MDSAHQRYRHIHYKCLIHTSQQLHTVHTKGIGLIPTICLIYQNPQLHCTSTLTPSPPVTFWHSILVLHQNSDVQKCSLPAKPWTWGLLQACFPGMRGCVIQVIMSLSAHWLCVQPPIGHSDLSVGKQLNPSGPHSI